MMKIFKNNGKSQLKISKSEWLKIGLMFKQSQDLSLVKKMEKLDERELTRAIRDAIVAEIGAIKQYETIVDSTDNKKAKKVLQDISDEERVHVGELQELLNNMLKDEKELLDEGANEVKGIK